MKTTFDRIVMTAIALALTVIALNPWLAPGRAGAAGGVVEVDIRRIDGTSISRGSALPVKIVK